MPVTTMHSRARPAAGREEVLAGHSAGDKLRRFWINRGTARFSRTTGEQAPPGCRPARYWSLPFLILGRGMLLATHKYVTSHWNPFVGLPLLSDVFVIGREGVTTTDVNLRSDASVANAPIGLAEAGSRIKILATGDNWYEVQVLQHGRAKADPFTSDKGWINKKFVRFD